MLAQEYALLKEISKYEGVLSCMLLTKDGICKEHINLPPSAHADVMAVMYATTYGAAISASTELSKSLSHLEISLREERIYIFPSGDDLIAVQTKESTNLSSLLDLIRKQ